MVSVLRVRLMIYYHKPEIEIQEAITYLRSQSFYTIGVFNVDCAALLVGA